MSNPHEQKPHEARQAPLGFTVKDAAKVLGIGRTTVYALLGEGRLKARKVAGRTIVEASSVTDYWASLPSWK